MKDKKSFLMYLDNKDVFYELDDKKAGKLIKGIFRYHETGEIIEDRNLKPLFIILKNTFDRDEKKWEDIKQKRSEAGKKGMEKRWKNDNKITNDNTSYQPVTKITDSVSGSVSVSVSGSVINNIWDTHSQCDCITNTNERCKRRASYEIDGIKYCNQHARHFAVDVIDDQQDTIFPTLDELNSYCLENEMGDFDCEKFYDYYEANGWLNKNGSEIKDWKAKVRSWYREDKAKGKLKKNSDDRRLK